LKLLGKPLDSLALFELICAEDNRGFFRETFRQEWLEKAGIQADFVQENHSRSSPGVLRGLHYQTSPAQGKLVCVKRGRIWDVSLDVRKDSPTFGQHFATELSDSNRRLLWIPPGFAHGFCVLGDEPADVSYKVSSYYNPSTEMGVRWNDPSLGIDWPIKDPILSPKDKALPLLQ
jgi:dTDP-4-dehydrorhamnose 3,5-epimerase